MRRTACEEAAACQLDDCYFPSGAFNGTAAPLTTCLEGTPHLILFFLNMEQIPVLKISL